jgi:predicted nucleic acid-binding protein
MSHVVRDRLYLDTSILGALDDPGPRDRVDATRQLLDGLARGLAAGHISVVVLEEVERAPRTVREKVARELRRGYLMVLQESDETIRLAGLYVSAHAVPEEYADDARHIAVATVNDIRVVVSWNFRHMVNIERKRRINSVNIREGYPLIDLVSPWEITYGEA